MQGHHKLHEDAHTHAHAYARSPAIAVRVGQFKDVSGSPVNEECMIKAADTSKVTGEREVDLILWKNYKQSRHCNIQL